MPLAEQLTQIHALAQQGKTPSEIAGTVGIEIGDVQSVLAGAVELSAPPRPVQVLAHLVQAGGPTATPGDLSWTSSPDGCFDNAGVLDVDGKTLHLPAGLIAATFGGFFTLDFQAQVTPWLAFLFLATWNNIPGAQAAAGDSESATFSGVGWLPTADTGTVKVLDTGGADAFAGGAAFGLGDLTLALLISA